MTEIKKQMRRDGEQGNVLFLILIAVALFAALSYAVTQSTRSGGGDAGKETNLVNSSQLTQYPAGVRTALVRMIIGGKAVDTPITFNSPSDFGSITVADNVFHPTGGGATYMRAPSDVMLSTGVNPSGTWYFNANFEIPKIGTDGAGGNDVIAFLPGITLSVCNQLNTKYGITTLPVWNPAEANITASIVEGGASPEDFPATAMATFTAVSPSATALDGQPFGCFQDSSTSAYIYYHTLIER